MCKRDPRVSSWTILSANLSMCKLSQYQLVNLPTFLLPSLPNSLSYFLSGGTCRGEYLQALASSSQTYHTPTTGYL